VGGIQVEPVTTRQDLRRFIELPYQIYGRDPHWVPPLRIQQRELFDTKKHPFINTLRFNTFWRLMGRVR